MKRFYWIWKIALLAVVAAPFYLWSQHEPEISALDRVQAEGVLRVVSRNSPTTFYEAADGFSGMEYDLLKLFADELGVKLDIKLATSFKNIPEQVRDRVVDFAAAGLTVTLDRQKNMRFVRPYQSIRQQVIYRYADKPSKPEDLKGGKLELVAGSSYEEQLRKLLGKTEPLYWVSNAEEEAEGLLQKVWQGDIDYTVADSNIVKLERRFYPQLRVAFDLTDDEQLAWAFPLSNDESLYGAADDFIRRQQENGILDTIRDKYYGHLPGLDQVEHMTFTKHRKSRLAKYKPLFLQAAVDTGFDWKLLAAVSYQESHWNPKAISRTGVRGIMMLTQITAREMGVKNRLDAESSVQGGARYLKKIHGRLDEKLTEPDRTWFALAAYNMGIHHLRDVRKLAASMGAKSQYWAHVKPYLPYLSKKRYYKKTRHGYARGREALVYVENIRSYLDLLTWYEQQRAKLTVAKGEGKASEIKPVTHIMGDAL